MVPAKTDLEDIVLRLGSRSSAERRKAQAELQAMLEDDHRDLNERVQALDFVIRLDPEVTMKLWRHLLRSPEKILVEETLSKLRVGLAEEQREFVFRELIDDDELSLKALTLAETWKDPRLGEHILDRLTEHDEAFITEAIHILGVINFTLFSKRLTVLQDHPSEEVRITLAKNFLVKGGAKVGAEFYQRCLLDPCKVVRKVGLTGARHTLSGVWVEPLGTFILEHQENDEQCEALRLLGTLNDKRAVKILMDLLFDPDHEKVHWACQQALDLIDQDYRLPLLKNMLDNSDEKSIPKIIDLLGHCEGKEPFNILEKALERFKDPSLRALIASAIGTVGYHKSEEVLLKMMKEDLAVTYSAAAALKIVARERVLEHYEEFLRSESIDDLVKQTILQHVGEAARSLKVPETLIALIETLLNEKNDSVRYLSVVALGYIQQPRSIAPLLSVYRHENMLSFRGDCDKSLGLCCAGLMYGVLDALTSDDAENEVIESGKEYLSGANLLMTEADLNLLHEHPLFEGWNWDRALVHCTSYTHTQNRNFVWQHLVRKDLPEKTCCMLARTLENVGVKPEEMLEPGILLDCFSRYEKESTLLLIGRLMSKYQHPDFLQPLIQFTENIDEDLQVIFKSYVRTLILGH